MRTKTLVCAAALLAAGVATSMAQSNVYSLNVVGYYNITANANVKILIGNQLNTTNNTLGGVLPNVPPGSQFFKYNGGYSAYTFDDLDSVWTPDGLASLAPGEGGFFISPQTTTLTFVGEVKQGSLTNTLPINTKVLRSPIVPQAGGIAAVHQIPGEPGDQMFTYSGGFSAFTFDDLDSVWTPTEPVMSVGQGFFYTKASTSASSNWVRNFTVQ
jgi:hypothetical protein